MKDDQKNIYYISGDDKDSLLKSPSVEKLLARDIEIIFMTDSVDEYTVPPARRPDAYGTCRSPMCFGRCNI